MQQRLNLSKRLSLLFLSLGICRESYENLTFVINLLAIAHRRRFVFMMNFPEVIWLESKIIRSVLKGVSGFTDWSFFGWRAKLLEVC